MTRLLNKQFRAFTVYALIVLACSIPAYFLIVDGIWLEELDEHNTIVVQRITEGLDSLKLDEQTVASMLDLWSKTQPGIRLTPNASNAQDSIYEVMRTLGTETDRFRGLARSIRINDRPFLLTVETNVEESKETIAAIAAITILFFVVLVVGFVLLNRRISVNAWKPFYTALKELRSFNLHKQQQLNLQTSNISEFEELNQVLKKLIETVVSSYREQKEFTENASHELQTPLAIIQSKLDLLLQNKELTSAQYQNIEDINETLTRISRINRNLLLLTKIENNQYSAVEEVAIRDVIRKQFDFFAQQATEKGITVETGNLSDVKVKANPILLDILVSNLFLNAIRHNAEKGKLIVSLDGNKLQVANTGADQPLLAEKLFKRFARASSAAAGSGLGLAIVKGIADAYGWHIHYSYSEQVHTFTVEF